MPVRCLVVAVLSICVLPAAAGAEVAPVQTLHGEPQVETAAGTTTITTGGQSAGVFWTYQLDPAVRYRVVIRGHRVQNGFTLRIREGTNPLEYQAAPDGEFSFTVHGESALELLFYYVDPATYEVRDIEVTPCPECRTDQDLRARILGDIPGLEWSLAHAPVRAAEMLLGWASPKVTFAGPPPAPFPTNMTSAADMFYLNFEPRRGGVFCDGAVDFYRWVLELFGLPALRVQLGEGALLHTTVVLPVETGNRWRFFLVDPTFGISISEKRGAPLELIEALQRMKRGKVNRIRVVEQDVSARALLVGENIVQCSEADWATPCAFSIYRDAYSDDLAEGGYRGDEFALLDVLRATAGDLLEGGPADAQAAFRQALDAVRADARSHVGR